MTPFQKNIRNEFYLQHLCPYWGNEEQWLKLIDKVIFRPHKDGGLEISKENLSFNEVKILDGYSLSSLLEQREIHHDERKALMQLQKINQEIELKDKAIELKDKEINTLKPNAFKGEKFNNPKPRGLSKETKKLHDYIKSIYCEKESLKKLHNIYEKNKPSNLPIISYSSFCRHCNTVKKSV